MSDLKRMLAGKWGCAVEMQRLWPWEQRGNLSVRLANPLEVGCDSKHIFDIAVGCFPCADAPVPDVSSHASAVGQTLFSLHHTDTQACAALQWSTSALHNTMLYFGNATCGASRSCITQLSATAKM